ncbi:MAG: MaoC family dehydratase N-terminal domain-containing protein [Dehalococcoidia bacterium]
MDGGDTVEAGPCGVFVQATMDEDPNYWDPEAAQSSKFGAVVAPPLYPSFAFRRRPGTPDPLDEALGNRDFDGLRGFSESRLPEIPHLPVRMLNGGVEAEFFAQAKVGDRITGQTRYADIYEREGRTGRMLFIVTETTFTNQDGVVLVKTRNTAIRR